MNKQEMLQYYKQEEDYLVASKILDKIEYCKKRNKIVSTDFLDIHQLKIAKQLLDNTKVQNFKIEGGFQEAQRKILVMYPYDLQEKQIQEEKIIQEIIGVIRITLPKELIGQYEHRNYLSGLMKLGIKREKFGDILVTSQGADIITKTEILEYFIQNIPTLTRFSKAKIEIKSIKEIEQITIPKKKDKIIVANTRMDAIVAELARTSRNKAEEIIQQGRVWVNCVRENKNSKMIQQGDCIVIRGKGKFEIGKIIQYTKSGKIILEILSYSY